MLIKCPECGGSVSDKAPACIHCGFPLSNIHKENICLVDGQEYDMTPFKELYDTLSKEAQKGFYKKNIEKFGDPRAYVKISYPESFDEYAKITNEINQSVRKHFGWWDQNNNAYLGYKFITTCIDHNFQYFEFNTADIPDPSKTVRCPKCGSTSVTPQERGYNLMWGMLGSTKKKNLCQRCGYTWWPGAGK